MDRASNIQTAGSVKRRWFNFSLRTLFVLVTLLAAVMGYLTWKAAQLRARDQRIAELEEMGAYIVFAYETQPPWFRPRAPAFLRSYLGEHCLDAIYELRLEGEQITDELLARIATLEDVWLLDLYDAHNVTDRGLDHVARMSSLIGLLIESRHVSPQGCVPLHSLGLRDLTVGPNGAIDDSWLPELAKLNIAHLNLSFTSVTDSGLVALHGAKTLEGLSLTGTKTTAAGVDELRKSLPNCKIYWP